MAIFFLSNVDLEVQIHPLKHEYDLTWACINGNLLHISNPVGSRVPKGKD